MKILISLFILLGLVFSDILVVDWELIKEQKDIKVFVRKTEGNPLKEVKIEGQVKCRMSELVAALEDIEAQKKWVKSTIDAKILSKEATDKFLFYMSTDFPYPVKDRDVVISYSRSQNPQSKIVTINYEGKPEAAQEQTKFVRIPYFQASYTLKPAANGYIKLTYLLKADIGGSIPKWIVNMAITKGPMDTIESLFKLINSGYYKEAIVEGVND